ncbi:hypothetical protein EVA_03751 [gut metagenome]|uniref:Uncharacterized protein n=1 Tax=gut metagenome TaxID=749906 RepID=J9GK56_9ZZZZ
MRSNKWVCFIFIYSFLLHVKVPGRNPFGRAREINLAEFINH